MTRGKDNIFVVSDTHFSHGNIVEWGLRPADFTERLWKGIEALPEEAILIHCGDITIGADYATHERLRKLKIKKWLVRGNHDNHSITWYVRNGWDFVADEIVVKMFGVRTLFTHMPTPKREGIDRNVHGHLHGGKSRNRPDFYDPSYHIEVCPEVVGYIPVKLK